MTSDFPRLHLLSAALGVALAAAVIVPPASATSTQPDLLRVDARELGPLATDRAHWMERFEAGEPILVHIDNHDRATVARAFGAVPSEGDAIYVRQPNGDVAILRPSAGIPRAAWEPRWTSGMSASLAAFQVRAAEIPALAAADTTNAGSNDAGLPMIRFHEGSIESGSDEITGIATITAFRSATGTEDDKEIHVAAWPVITPAKAGVDNGDGEGRNITGAYLPWGYRVAHEVTAEGDTPDLVHYAPKSAGPTDFEKTEVDEREVGIGGSQGNLVSEDGQPNAGLASKLPFNLSVSYRHLVRNELRYRFPDYSLSARPAAGGVSVLWEAPVNEKFKHTLVEHVGADNVELTEKRMTPMMRSATLPTTSVWELPGDFEGMARVTLRMGYDLNEKEWWWDGPERREKDEVSSVTRAVSYDIALDSPFLTRETTVLLRSSEGAGGCITQRGGAVLIAACDKTDRNQMWGLDSEARYINRGSGECLEAQVEAKRMVTAACNLSGAQVWEWRADRIHSGYGDRRHRLHVVDGALAVFVEDGQFDDVPVNPHYAVLKPWAGYPKAPLAGELVPAPFGRQAGQVPAAWDGQYGAVGAEQRWTPVVLRYGMK